MGIKHHGSSGQTLHALVDLLDGTYKGIALNADDTVYSLSDSQLVSGGMSSVDNDYPYSIRTGAASDTPSGNPVGAGVIGWTGSIERPLRANITTTQTFIETPEWELIAEAAEGSASGNGVVTDTIDNSGATIGFLHLASTDVDDSAFNLFQDNLGNYWQKLNDDVNSAFARSRFYICYNPRTSDDYQFSVTGPGLAPTVHVKFFKGNYQLAPLDQSNFGSASSTTRQPGSITPTEDGELLIVVSSQFGSGDPTINLSFVGSDSIGYNSIGGGGNMGGGMWYLVQSSAAAINPTITTAGSGGGIARIYSFKAAPVAPDVTVIPQIHRRVWQREKYKTSKVIPFEGYWVGYKPASAEIREYMWTNEQPLSEWRPLEGFSPNDDGSWAATPRIEQNHWSKYQVRTRDIFGKVLATSRLTDSKTAVHFIHVDFGQSNSAHKYVVKTSQPTQDDEVSVFDGTDWALVIGEGATTWGNIVREATGFPIGLLNAGIGGAGLDFDGGSGKWTPDDETVWTNFIAKVEAAGGDFESALWAQGEADTIDSDVTESSYQTALDVLIYDQVLPLINRTMDCFDLGIRALATLNEAFSTNARATIVRQALIEYPIDRDGVYLASCAIDAERSDNYHYTGASHINLSDRDAESFLHAKGLREVPGNGPSIFNAYRMSDSNDVYVTPIGLAGYSLEEADGGTTGEGLTGFSTGQTINSTSFVGNLIKLNHSTAPTAVEFCTGLTPTITNLPHSSFHPNDSSIGLPLRPHASISVEVRTPFATGDLITTARLPLSEENDVGYTLFSNEGLQLQARATENISILADDQQGVLCSAYFTPPVDFDSGYVVWDNRETAVQDTAVKQVTVEEIADAVHDEALSGHTTVGSAGEALRAARAQGFGRWVLNSDTNILSLYDTDGTTVVQSFLVGPNLNNPLTRTPQ